MYVVTNRRVLTGRNGLAMFGRRPSPKGPNELRLFRADRDGDQWKVSPIPDRLDRETKQKLGYRVSASVPGSALVAHEVLERAAERKRNVVFFVHGYNNDMRDVLERAARLETNYKVDVVAFSWPANGGGLRGTASYKSDKRDAKASVGALDRTLEKMGGYLDSHLERVRKELLAEAMKRHPDNPEQRDALFASLSEKRCPVKISMLAHSMGNYLYKHLLLSTASEGSRLLFDNVILACADTNNLEHKLWVDRIRYRSRVFITINEADHALKASRIKTGQEQLARLGHFPFVLDSQNGVYVDFTDAPGVGSSHAYFEGDPVATNPAVQEFFFKALNGQAAEESLPYRTDRNLYTIRQAP